MKVLLSLRGASLGCAQHWLDRLGSEEMFSALNTQNQSQKCQQLCNRQIETVMMASGKYPSKQTFSEVILLLSTFKKIFSLVTLVKAANELIFPSKCHVRY